MASPEIARCQCCGREVYVGLHPWPLCRYCLERVVSLTDAGSNGTAEQQAEAIALEDMPWLVHIADVTEELDTRVSLPPAVALAEILKLTEEALADHAAGRASYLALCSTLEKVRRFASMN